MEEKWYFFTDVFTKRQKAGKLLKYDVLLLNVRYILWDWSYSSNCHVDGWKGRKKKITSPKRLRGLTLKPKIVKKRSEWVKIDIQYNDDGQVVGKGYVQLVTYLGVLAQTMVKVYHTD